MPTCFQFKRDGEVVNLIEIDKLICEACKEPIDDKRYSWQYDSITWMGIIATKGTGRTVTSMSLAEAISHKEKPYTEKWVMLFKRFLVEEFTFHAWWESKK